MKDVTPWPEGKRGPINGRGEPPTVLRKARHRVQEGEAA